MTTDSSVFPEGTHTHSVDDTRDWMDEVFRARLYAGFHFHHSLEDGRLGQAVAQQLLQNHFRKVVPAP